MKPFLTNVFLIDQELNIFSVICNIYQASIVNEKSFLEKKTKAPIF